jgi:hypothetical protein
MERNVIARPVYNRRSGGIEQEERRSGAKTLKYKVL